MASTNGLIASIAARVPSVSYTSTYVIHLKDCLICPTTCSCYSTLSSTWTASKAGYKEKPHQHRTYILWLSSADHLTPQGTSGRHQDAQPSRCAASKVPSTSATSPQAWRPRYSSQYCSVAVCRSRNLPASLSGVVSVELIAQHFRALKATLKFQRSTRSQERHRRRDPASIARSTFC